MSRRRTAVVAGVVLTLAASAGVLALRQGPASDGLNTPLSQAPPALRLLACGPRFEFAGSSYRIRSDTPFPPGPRLGRAVVADCHDTTRRVAVSVHAYEGVDPKAAVGVRNGATVLALAPGPCLGLRDGELIRCLRSTG